MTVVSSTMHLWIVAIAREIYMDTDIELRKMSIVSSTTPLGIVATATEIYMEIAQENVRVHSA